MDSRRGECWVYEQGKAKLRERKEPECLTPDCVWLGKAREARKVGQGRKRVGRQARIKGVVFYYFPSVPVPVRGTVMAGNGGMAESRRIWRRLGWV